MRRWSAAAVLVSGLLLSAAPRAAHAVNDAFTRIEFRCQVTNGSVSADTLENSVSMSANCDSSASVSTNYLEAVAYGVVSLNPSSGLAGPHIDLAANLVIPPYGGLPAGSGEARMVAQADYYVEVVQTAPPPYAPYDIPVTVSYMLDTTEFAGASVSVAGFAVNSVGDDFKSGSFTRIFHPGQQASVHLAASVWITGNSLDGIDAGAQAVADPIIELDQAAFDVAAGGSGFPLADFYELVFSEHVVNEPDVLFASGFEAGGLPEWSASVP